MPKPSPDSLQDVMSSSSDAMEAGPDLSGHEGGDRGPEVSSHDSRPRKTRRKFTKEQKIAILAEAARCTERGDVAALLRRHGLYSSTLSSWRKALATGNALRGVGRPPKGDAKDKEIAELRKRLAKAEGKLARAEDLVELQKKAFSLLEAVATLGER